jgi:hypothetical protein
MTGESTFICAPDSDTFELNNAPQIKPSFPAFVGLFCGLAEECSDELQRQV